MVAVEEVDWEQGEVVATLLLDPSSWAFRRVESIEFVDEHSLRRRVSLDFDVREANVATVPKVVPFGLLNRETLVKFDLYDESGDRVPLLTADQGREVTYWTLAALARRILEGREPHAKTLSELFVLASATEEETALDLLTAWKAAGSTAEGGVLLRDPDFWRLAHTLSRNFILFAPEEGAGRGILKFAYLTPLARARGAQSRIFRALGSLGWLPIRFVLPAPAIGESASYHLEVTVPDGLTLFGADLRIRHPAEKEYELPIIPPVAGHRTIAHFVETESEPADSGVAFLTIGAPGASPVTMSAVACLLVAVLLSLVASLRPVQLAELRDASSILLAFPGLLALAVVRSGEHPLLRRVMLGLRVTVTVCGVVALVAASQIGIGLARVCLRQELWPGAGAAPCVSPSLGWWATLAWICVVLLVPPFVSAMAGPRLAKRFHVYGKRREYDPGWNQPPKKDAANGS